MMERDHWLQKVKGQLCALHETSGEGSRCDCAPRDKAQHMGGIQHLAFEMLLHAITIPSSRTFCQPKSMQQSGVPKHVTPIGTS